MDSKCAIKEPFILEFLIKEYYPFIMSESATNRHIGKIIRSLRLNVQLTQKQLSDELNIHEKHLGKIERGEKAVTISLLDKLCKYFNKPHVYFFDFSEDESLETELPELALLRSLDKDTRLKLIKVIKIFLEK